MAELRLINGGITDDELLNMVDAVVNATNPAMAYGGGVAGAIYRKAGDDQLWEYVQRTFDIDRRTGKGFMQIGEIRKTPGFNMPCDIIFAQGPRATSYETYEESEKMLLKTYENLINESVKMGYKSILTAPLGTGIYGFQHNITAKKVMELILRSRARLTVYLVLYEKNVYDYYDEIKKGLTL